MMRDWSIVARDCNHSIRNRAVTFLQSNPMGSRIHTSVVTDAQTDDTLGV